MSFVHLRVHSEYSFLRGACRLEELVLQAKKLGMPAVALTDYNTLHGAVRFTQAALRHGIIPLLGVETKLCGLPAVLLVRNRRGWSNLVRLVNLLALAGPGQKQLQPQELADFSPGLTVILHPAGEIDPLKPASCAGMAGEALASLLPCCEEFYLAIENAGLPGTEKRNRLLAELAASRGVPLLATHNVHYTLPGDDIIYRMLNCIRTGKPLAGAAHFFLPGTGYYLLPPEVMRRRFAAYPQACENTLRVAESCSFVLQREGMHLPKLVFPGETAEQVLQRLCRESLADKGLQYAGYLRRLESELPVIFAKGLASYFLIVRDLVEKARREGIPVGPGRGSAGGSLVTYLLGITRVDPLRHGLYFERFLSADREGFPDIDLDVCHRRRDELLAYLRSRYGDGHIAQVSTFSTLGARAAVREVGKLLEISSAKVAAVAGAMPGYSFRGSIDEASRHSPELQPLLDRDVRWILENARRLEGMCRHLSTHAAGIILGAADLTGRLPLCRGPSGEVLSQWDKDDVEAMGFLKIDILGSRNLTIINDTLTFIRRRQGGAPAVEELPLADEETYAMLRRAESLGCFQLESTGMRRVLRLLAPEKITDLIYLLSLYRPGPWENGTVKTFIDRRRGAEKTVYPHPQLAGILSETYGVILYQEQLMRIACEIGGFTPGEADRLRRELAGRSSLLREHWRQKFLAGAARKGLTGEEALEIFELLSRFAGYSFNKAHSAAYALVSYWTAYLKRHYPVEYYAALLSTGYGYYGTAVYVHEAGRRGIQALPPHINRSGLLYLPEGAAIRAPLPLVRDLGGRGAAAILQARQTGPFRSLSDFCRRLGRGALRRSALVNLIKVGAFDGLGLNRRQALACLDYILKRTDRFPGQMTLWPPLAGCSLPELAEYNEEEILAAEAEVLGMTLSRHPLARFAGRLSGISRLPLAELPRKEAGEEATVAAIVLARSRRRLPRGGIMLTLFLSDESGFAEAVVYPREHRRLLRQLQENMLLLKGKKTTESDSLAVEDAVPLVLLPEKEKEKRAAN